MFSLRYSVAVALANASQNLSSAQSGDLRATTRPRLPTTSSPFCRCEAWTRYHTSVTPDERRYARILA